jgi:DNA polymerase III alpha subunit
VVAQDYTLLPNIRDINNQILDLSKELNLKCLVHNNYHYPKIEDKEAREVALAIKDGKKMYDDDRRKPK